MDSYRSGYGWEQGIVLILIAMALTAIVAVASEIGRIYGRWAFSSESYAKMLWLAGIVFIFVVIAGVQNHNPSIIGYSFLVYVVVIEMVDWSAARREAALSEELSLDEVIGDIGTKSNSRGQYAA